MYARGHLCHILSVSSLFFRDKRKAVIGVVWGAKGETRGEC